MTDVTAPTDPQIVDPASAPDPGPEQDPAVQTASAIEDAPVEVVVAQAEEAVAATHTLYYVDRHDRHLAIAIQALSYEAACNLFSAITTGNTIVSAPEEAQ